LHKHQFFKFLFANIFSYLTCHFLFSLICNIYFVLHLHYYIVFLFLGVSFAMASTFIYKASLCTSLSFSSFIFFFEFNSFLLLKFLCTLFLHFTLLLLVEFF
jgi:hypothetical protein